MKKHIKILFNQSNLHSPTTKYLIDRVSLKQIHDSPFLFDPIQIDFTSPTPVYVHTRPIDR